MASIAERRKKAEDIVCSYLDEMDPSGTNSKIHRELIFKISDAEFTKLVEDIESGKRYLVMTAANYGPVKLDFNRNVSVGKKLGVNYFEKVWFKGNPDIPDHLSPVEFLVMPTNIRRQAQLVTKGASVPDHMRSINALTGQPTGESQAAKMTMIETVMLSSTGLEAPLVELTRERGGDSRAGAALTGMLISMGRASLKNLSAYSSGTQAKSYVQALFNAAHLNINL